MHMKVSHDQFDIDGERLTHRPTGAQFWLGQRDVVLCEPGRAGQDLGAGTDYDLKDLKSKAWEMFALERARCV